MRTRVLAWLFASSVLASHLAFAGAESVPTPAGLKVAPLQYRQRTLTNGLTVFSIENHRSPTVAVQVWYHVGGKDDPPGRSGFAHLFEHMMFKSTKNQKSENFDRLTEDVGGQNNAFTQEDATVYHEIVPSNYLETLLWAEADRMANLSVDEANFVSERAVVEEEFRQSVLARPYGRLEIYVEQHSYAVHPYKNGVIGSIADLDSATLEDVRKFHRTYYRADNATLIVSGDFDSAQLDGWVDRYFGRIRKPADPVPRVSVVEPARTKEARFNTSGPNVPLPATSITYLLPPRKSPDSDALRVTEVILGRGESSRLNQSLVYRQQIAASANASADLRDDAGLFGLKIITAGGKSAAEGEQAALAEVDKLEAEGVTAAELDKARNMLLADVLGARETAEGQAFALGEAAVSFGDPERVNTDISRLEAVTAGDVQRVAQRYFSAENRVVVRYENGQEEQGGQSHAAKAAPPTTTLAFQPEETPPAPTAPRAVTFPKPVEKRLPNGLRVVTISRPGTGLVTVSAVVQAGSVLDPNPAAGLADFTASLLTRGTTAHSAPQIVESIEALGGDVSSSARWDSAGLTLSSLAARLGDALPTFAEVLRSPAFATEEIERLRSERLDDLAVSLRQPGTLARLTAARVVFGDSGYGHPANGTPATVKALEARQINQFYRSRYQPTQTVLVFGGDITPETAFSYAEKHFGDWKAQRVEGLPAPKAAATRPGGRVVVVDKPDAGQAAVCVARATIRRADRQYAIGRVANGVLGEGYSSRMNQEVRIKRGLSYGASSSLGVRKESGLFIASAQTRNDAAAEVANLLKTELSRLASEPVPSAELVPRKAALSGNYARELETGAGLVSTVGSLITDELPLSALNDYLPRIQKVTAAQIQRFAARDLEPGEASVIIVGDGRQFLQELQKQFPKAEVIPVDKLDLNRAGLVAGAESHEGYRKELPLPGEVWFVEGHAAFNIPARESEPNREKPWVWYAPTLPGLPGSEERWMFDRFLQAGIAVAGIDVGESYGSPAGRALFTTFHHAMTTRGYSSKPVLLGRSRGGLMTLSWAVENPDKVGAFAGIYPVCNLATYPGIAKAAAAYEMPASELQAHLKQHNPIDRLASLAKVGIPLFAIHGDTDIVVPLNQNSGLMCDRYTALGGSMQLIIPSGQGHNMWTGFFQNQELVDFVKAHAGIYRRSAGR